MFVSIENSEIFAHEIPLPKQTHTCSQEKMPFRDKNQTVQINIKPPSWNDAAQDRSVQQVLSQH